MNEKAGGESAIKVEWASIKPRLGDLIHSRDPHVRINIARIAVALVAKHDDQQALQVLVDSAVQLLSELDRQQAIDPRVLEEIMVVRSGIGDRPRIPFDEKLRQELERLPPKDWNLGQVLAVLEKGLPIEVLPLDLVARAIFADASELPVDPKSMEEVNKLDRLRDKIEAVEKYYRAADADWQRRLHSKARELMNREFEDGREYLLYGLLRAWPALVKGPGDEPPLKSGNAQLKSAKLGKRGIFRAGFAGSATAAFISTLVLYGAEAIAARAGYGPATSLTDWMGGTGLVGLGVVVVAAIVVGPVFGLSYSPKLGSGWSLNTRLRHALLPAILPALVMAVMQIIFANQNIRISELSVWFGLISFLAFALIADTAHAIACLPVRPNGLTRIIPPAISIGALPAVGATLALLIVGKAFENPEFFWTMLLANIFAASQTAWVVERRSQLRPVLTDETRATRRWRMAIYCALVCLVVILLYLVVSGGCCGH